MSEILSYSVRCEAELLSLLEKEQDWDVFTAEDRIEHFKSALLNSKTFICKTDSGVNGYIRVIVDAFGVYVSELYVAPGSRGNGYGKALLNKVKSQHPNQDVYILSDEDAYYEKLGYKCVGSVFKL